MSQSFSSWIWLLQLLAVPSAWSGPVVPGSITPPSVSSPALATHESSSENGIPLGPGSSGPPSMVPIRWPTERLPWVMHVNGQKLVWRPSASFHFKGFVRFGPGMPVADLPGPVDLEGVPGGWRLTWHAAPEAWIAAATEGELGSAASFEAKRALAAVLRAWLEGHPAGNHPDGTLCPLTHCAVVRGTASLEGRRAATQAPAWVIPPGRAFFTGSTGGVSLSPREVWGSGSKVAGWSRVVPGDPWATWSRTLTAAQVRALKGAVKPGLRPGQRGMFLGASGPYAIENLRVEAGRRFGWTAWPSNACTAELLHDGSLSLRGQGWGHNVGLCLATAIHRARLGERAEQILAEAFPAEKPDQEK